MAKITKNGACYLTAHGKPVIRQEEKNHVAFSKIQWENTVNRISAAKFLNAGTFFVSMIVIGSFMTDTIIASAQAQTQPGVKRKFGPGQNAAPVRGVRPQGRAPVQRQRPPQAAPAEVIATEGKWIVQCDAPIPGAKDAAKKPRECGLLQTAVHKTNKQLGLTLILRQAKQGKQTTTMMQILAPVGVYLPTGVALEVDGKAAGRVPFSRCGPRFCVAFAQMRKETLATLQKGKKGKFLIYEAPGVGIPIDLELAGFSTAFKILEKIPK
ncbi:hypothetical protein MNBD_ALPHA08-1788 [hydrothermal vent metagenome]|uniref:Uncharacterized protein n=1 Tax=hydrothermal vent metagenome TaxID=652676 RepID=A0A3B0SBZ2_9ZZZZ